MSTALLSRDNPLLSSPLCFFFPSLSVCLSVCSAPTLSHSSVTSPPVRQPRCRAGTQPNVTLLRPASQLPPVSRELLQTHTCKHKHMEKTKKHQLQFAEQGCDISPIGPPSDVAPRTFDHIFSFATARLPLYPTPSFSLPPALLSLLLLTHYTHSETNHSRALLPSSICDPGFTYIRLLSSYTALPKTQSRCRGRASSHNQSLVSDVSTHWVQTKESKTVLKASTKH